MLPSKLRHMPMSISGYSATLTRTENKKKDYHTECFVDLLLKIDLTQVYRQPSAPS
jgi:hypothetical protein